MFNQNCLVKGDAKIQNLAQQGKNITDDVRSFSKLMDLQTYTHMQLQKIFVLIESYVFK